MTQKQEIKRERDENDILWFVKRNPSGSYEVADHDGKVGFTCETQRLANSTAAFFTVLDRA